MGGGPPGGGDVDDVLERLGSVESHVSELRSQVSGLLAVIPYLATKADIGNLKAAIVQRMADTA